MGPHGSFNPREASSHRKNLSPKPLPYPLSTPFPISPIHSEECPREREGKAPRPPSPAHPPAGQLPPIRETQRQRSPPWPGPRLSGKCCHDSGSIRTRDCGQGDPRSSPRQLFSGPPAWVPAALPSPGLTVLHGALNLPLVPASKPDPMPARTQNTPRIRSPQRPYGCSPERGSPAPAGGSRRGWVAGEGPCPVILTSHPPYARQKRRPKTTS